MTRHTFDVTYEIVTEESAEYGDAEERGFIDKNMTLRDALEAVRATRTNRVDGVTAIELSSSGHSFAWITICNGMEYETGAYESRSIHLPDSLTGSTRVRVARLLGARIL